MSERVARAERIPDKVLRREATVVPFVPKPSILDTALALSKAGIAIHWLKHNDKVPVDKNWSTAPTATPESLRSSYKSGFNVGIRPGAPSDLGGVFLHVLDLDVRDETKAAEPYAWLDETWPDWRSFPIVQSGSMGSSRHIYFFASKAHRSRGLARSDKQVEYDGRTPWAWQIDLYGSGRQVAAPPSIHPLTGKAYRWLNPLHLDEFDLGIYPMIDSKILEAWGSPVDSSKIEHVNNDRLGLTLDEARAILAKLPFEEWNHNRDGWIRVGFALQHEFGDAGRELWDEFSAQSEKFDPDEQTKVWKSFRPRPDSLRMATLVAAARAVEIADSFDEIGDDDGTALDIEIDDQNATRPAENIKAAAGDIDAGKRFAKMFSGRYLHVYSTRTWLKWDCFRWADCSSGEEVEAVKALARALIVSSARAYSKNPTDSNKAALQYAQRLIRDWPRIRAVQDSARSEPTMVRSPDQFDADPMLLGVKNGVVDLRSGKLVPPDTSQMIRKQCGTAFNADAQCPKWKKFLLEIQPNSEVRRFLQVAVGYTLTGSVDEEKFFFAHGVGANGKSVFANVLEALCGEYAVVSSAQLLSKSRHESDASRLIAMLPGARLVLANETNRTDVWDDQRVKSLVSREKINARYLFKEAFSFFPTHKLWVRGNHLPGALDDTDGFWRRFIPVPFETQIPEEKRILDLDRQIIAEELSGVLNWAIEGCQIWQHEKLVIPAAVRRDVDAYRSDADLMGQWFAEFCIPDSNARTPISSAYDSYREFCDNGGISAPSKISFSKQMVRRPGIRRDASHGPVSRLIGFKLRSLCEDFTEDLL